jgi:hypothetical protein
LGEHLPCKQGVGGSSPLTSTRKQRSLKIEYMESVIGVPGMAKILRVYGGCLGTGR